ncbi:MAG: DNA-binding protein [archaeon]
MNDDAELEAIRQRKMAELQQEQEQEAQMHQAETNAKKQVQQVLRQILTQEAWAQWSTARMANENNAYAAAITLVKAVESGQIKGKITLEQLKIVLGAVSSQTHREFKIRRV